MFLLSYTESTTVNFNGQLTDPMPTPIFYKAMATLSTLPGVSVSKVMVFALLDRRDAATPRHRYKQQQTFTHSVFIIQGMDCILIQLKAVMDGFFRYIHTQ